MLDLFKQLPKFRPLTGQKQTIIPNEEQAHYPAFKEEFAILESELMPVFRELDDEALRQQNAYRWLYVILIFGTALTTIIAIVQLVIRADILGIVGAIVAACLGFVTLMVQSSNSHEGYLNARLAAERLRGEYFLFLGHLTPYENKHDRLLQLKQRVVETQIEGENNDAA